MIEHKHCFTNYIPGGHLCSDEQMHECQLCNDRHLCHGIKLIQRGSRIPESMAPRLVELDLINNDNTLTDYYNQLTGQDHLDHMNNMNGDDDD